MGQGAASKLASCPSLAFSPGCLPEVNFCRNSPGKMDAIMDCWRYCFDYEAEIFKVRMVWNVWETSSKYMRSSP